MRKSFDELTIADDYMFYRVMENTDICKTLLNIVLHDKTDTITDKKTVADAGSAKGKDVRFIKIVKKIMYIYAVICLVRKNDITRRIEKHKRRTN